MTPVKITVCAATCKRKAYLKILLDKLAEMNMPANIELKIVVVDNDPGKSAQEMVAGIIEAGYRFSLTYGFEQQRGIPFTRNKAVSLADKDSDFIAFIDDDEYPDPNWIAKLYEIQQQTDADLVQGPSLPKFVEEPPAWVVKGKFFLFAHYDLPTGSVQPSGSVATNNLLVKYPMLMRLKGPFDETMGLIGCDDTALGLNLHKIGCKMIYTKDAIAYEFIPASRTTVKWLLQRAYRSANTFWLLTDNKGPAAFIKLMAGAIARILIGAVCLLPALLIAPLAGAQYYIKALKLIVRGVAVIAGIFGKNYEEYKHAYTLPHTDIVN